MSLVADEPRPVAEVDMPTADTDGHPRFLESPRFLIANILIILYTIFTSIAPVVLWIFYFIMLDWDTTMLPIDFKNSLHNVTRVSFHLAVLIRLVFIAFVLGGVDRSSNKDLSNIYFQFTG